MPMTTLQGTLSELTQTGESLSGKIRLPVDSCLPNVTWEHPNKSKMGLKARELSQNTNYRVYLFI